MKFHINYVISKLNVFKHNIYVTIRTLLTRLQVGRTGFMVKETQ
jgi:hypothetical protein